MHFMSYYIYLKLKVKKSYQNKKLPKSLHVTDFVDADRRASINILRFRSVRECTDDSCVTYSTQLL